jgi:hypothetical protein
MIQFPITFKNQAASVSQAISLHEAGGKPAYSSNLNMEAALKLAIIILLIFVSI